MRLNRRLTFSEELGNTITHGVMATATLVLLPMEVYGDISMVVMLQP